MHCRKILGASLMAAHFALLGAPLAAQSIRFVDVTEAAGLKEPLLGIMGHGAAWGDVDNDGLADLYVGGFADRPAKEYAPAKAPVGNVLLKNHGAGKFERWAQPAVETFGRTSGALFVDLDNDGDLELYVANNTKGQSRAEPGPVRDAQLRRVNLFRNDAGKLVDITDECGACPIAMRTARNIGAFDYDGDGLLDLLVVEDMFTKNPRTALFKNLGGLKFKDVTTEVGLPDDIFGLGLAVADINDDGRADFFVGHSNRLFLSTKEGKYTENSQLNNTFALKPLDGEDWPCGAQFVDLNRDGLLDLVHSIHFVKARNRIYLNEGLKNGVPQFRDVTSAAGLPESLPNKSPHVEVHDFNNDGWPDIYLSTAWLDDDVITPVLYEHTGLKNGVPQFKANREFKEGDNVVYFPAGPACDYDNDGRIDLMLVNWFQGNHSRLLHNESDAKNHWLEVKVVGKSFNRQGLGSQISVYPAGKLSDKAALLGWQELTIGYGYASGQEAVCHFGVGDVDEVDVQVRLPNGKTIARTNVPVDQTLIIEE